MVNEHAVPLSGQCHAYETIPPPSSILRLQSFPVVACQASSGGDRDWNRTGYQNRAIFIRRSFHISKLPSERKAGVHRSECHYYFVLYELKLQISLSPTRKTQSKTPPLRNGNAAILAILEQGPSISLHGTNTLCCHQSSKPKS